MRAGSSSLFGVDDNGKARLIMSAKRENPIVITVSALEKRDLRTRDSRRSRYRTGHGCYQGYVAILAFRMSTPRSRSATCADEQDLWTRRLISGISRISGCHGLRNLGRNLLRIDIADGLAKHFANYRRTLEILKNKTTGLRRSISSHHL
jgi:hypothetical protein